LALPLIVAVVVLAGGGSLQSSNDKNFPEGGENYPFFAITLSPKQGKTGT